MKKYIIIKITQWTLWQFFQVHFEDTHLAISLKNLTKFTRIATFFYSNTKNTTFKVKKYFVVNTNTLIKYNSNIIINYKYIKRLVHLNEQCPLNRKVWLSINTGYFGSYHVHLNSNYMITGLFKSLETFRLLFNRNMFYTITCFIPDIFIQG